MMRSFRKYLTILVVIGEVVSIPMPSTASQPHRHMIEIQAFQFQPS